MSVGPHHVTESDYTCIRCRIFVRAGIPHECDPRVCRECNGTKRVWMEGFGWRICGRCDGTGLITFTRE